MIRVLFSLLFMCICLIGCSKPNHTPSSIHELASTATIVYKNNHTTIPNIFELSYNDIDDTIQYSRYANNNIVTGIAMAKDVDILLHDCTLKYSKDFGWQYVHSSGRVQNIYSK